MFLLAPPPPSPLLPLPLPITVLPRSLGLPAMPLLVGWITSAGFPIQGVQFPLEPSLPVEPMA